eukprot:TRINITY_DN84780_c0_g1_i1.p1 TRINITY_DN84780_c0_g1~~TRINITY_DN84780_c0_g1_i1.p1  ORF type:complete len:373 (+),score=45.58 TRINITY_DN84780_c0_g1_i1:32-1120(+)
MESSDVSEEVVLDSSATSPRRGSLMQWLPTSNDLAAEAERQMLAPLRTPYTIESVLCAVPFNNGDRSGPMACCAQKRGTISVSINTIVIGTGSPLVLLHGMAAGLAMWVANLDSLAERHTVYALDLPGFGLSQRVAFAGDSPEEAALYFVETVEAWRSALGLKEFALLGHSLGAYVAAEYAVQYPIHVRQLLLADPWGVQPKPPDWDAGIDWYWRVVAGIASKFNPLAIVRAAGPWGPDLLVNFRSDIADKFENVFQGGKQLVLDYIYHINARTPEGESAFNALADNFVWAKRPLLEHLPGKLEPRIPVAFAFGAQSWLDEASGTKLADLIGASVFTVPEAGHHVYIDNAPAFNSWVRSTLQ